MILTMVDKLLSVPVAGLKDTSKPSHNAVSP